MTVAVDRALNTDLAHYRALFELTGRTALVVGAGSGIGEASAHGLAAHGAVVYCADVDLDAAKRTADSIQSQGGNALPRHLDMLHLADIRAALAEIPHLDILVSTPSINVRKAVRDTSDEEVDRVLSLNLKGFYRLVREVGDAMAKQGSGSIIGLSSIRSTVVEPGQGIYAATKAGTVQILRSLAVELAPQGVRANAIAPGVVETPLTEQIKNDPSWYQAYGEKSMLRRWSQASEMVGAVVYLASDASSYVTGALLFVDGGWTGADGRFTPTLS
ncbi:MAG: SDR family oxidoreductase [Pseudonocardia sp.]|nr:SDR family oxidoreductase [Pseudonocardia sp.]MBO0874400.1 SDR family oxidoreductase [Pseudonocardia sp.]